MKNSIIFLLLLFSFNLIFSQVQNVDFSIEPAAFNENDEITITVSNFNPSAAWGVSDIYLWAWSLDKDDLNSIDSSTNGTWNNSNEVQKFAKIKQQQIKKLTLQEGYRREYLGNISHELKTPIAGSQIAIDSLKKHEWDTQTKNLLLDDATFFIHAFISY